MINNFEVREINKSLERMYKNVSNRLINEFLDDLHNKDNKIDCKYRSGGLPCKQCTNYRHCDDNNYPIIKKWEEKLK